MDTSGDSLLLGELMVGEEMIEESGGGRGEGEEKVPKETSVSEMWSLLTT